MRLFVIHSNDSPSRLASVTGLYDVSVFDFSENNLTYNKKASDLFGLSGDYVNEQEELFHIYPYKTRESVQAMIDSYLFKLADTTTSLNGRIKRKTFLHRDTPTSDSLEKTSSYLIENDKVQIKDTSIGWCQITFSSKTKSTTAWIKCSDIDIHEPRIDAAKNKGEPTGSPPLHSTTPTG